MTPRLVHVAAVSLQVGWGGGAACFNNSLQVYRPGSVAWCAWQARPCFARTKRAPGSSGALLAPHEQAGAGYCRLNPSNFFQTGGLDQGWVGHTHLCRQGPGSSTPAVGGGGGVCVCVCVVVVVVGGGVWGGQINDRQEDGQEDGRKTCF